VTSETEGERSGRLRLWEVQGGLHCSLVGTCLSTEDLTGIARRLGLAVDAGLAEHDLHSIFVRAAASEGPIARAMQRLLDKRHDGALRKVGRARGADELSGLWTGFRDAGLIPGAYWAFLTSSHVPEAVRVAVFGEVHMLSHLNGRSARETSERAARAEARAVELEERLKRAERRMEAATAERDERLKVLDGEVLRLKAELARSPRPAAAVEPRAGDREQRRVAVAAERSGRTIAALRAQLRAIEADNATLRERAAALAELAFDRQPIRVSVPRGADEAPASVGEAPPGGPGISILYLGGRTGHISRFRTIAEQWGAHLVHHDGGMEDTFHRIDELVGGADAVLCPVDCVSHSACRHAKRLCRKFCKRFVPLRTASGAAFERALADLARDGTGGEEPAAAAG